MEYKGWMVNSAIVVGGFGAAWLLMRRHILKSNNTVEEVAFRRLGVQPHYNVLELGFGYGHGLRCALDSGLREGTGTLYGVDYSEQACDHVRRAFKPDVDGGKLVIFNQDVATLPLDDSSIDRVFHTNCYYFWKDHVAVGKEILRVMKPGGLMITGLDLKKLRRAASNGFLTTDGWDPDSYMKCLVQAGFQDVFMENDPGQPKLNLIKAVKSL